MNDPRRDMVDALFRRYARGVGSYVLARVGNRDIAETITSAVFLIVVRVLIVEGVLLTLAFLVCLD